MTNMPKKNRHGERHSTRINLGHKFILLCMPFQPESANSNTTAAPIRPPTAQQMCNGMVQIQSSLVHPRHSTQSSPHCAKNDAGQDSSSKQLVSQEQPSRPMGTSTGECHFRFLPSGWREVWSQNILTAIGSSSSSKNGTGPSSLTTVGLTPLTRSSESSASISCNVTSSIGSCTRSKKCLQTGLFSSKCSMHAVRHENCSWQNPQVASLPT